jgi:AcrR family transcriptional regulator
MSVPESVPELDQDPRQGRSAQTRERLLDAALCEFSEKGYHGARVNEIARRAGANKQRIYAYFGSKDKLYAQVTRRAFEALSERDRQALECGSGDAAGMATAALEGSFRFHREHPQFWRLLAWENLEGGLHAESLDDIRRPTFELYREAYLEQQASGRFDAEVSFETFIYVISAIAFFASSNRRTILHSLGLDLDDPATEARIMGESLKLMGMTAGKPPADSAAESRQQAGSAT